MVEEQRQIISAHQSVSGPVESQDEAACLTVITIGYRAKCTEPGCRNLARAILRYGDRSGRPVSNSERCHAHAREALEGAMKAGLAIYDERKQRANVRGS